jgi:hypothetical protein
MINRYFHVVVLNTLCYFIIYSILLYVTLVILSYFKLNYSTNLKLFYFKLIYVISSYTSGYSRSFYFMLL